MPSFLCIPSHRIRRGAITMTCLLIALAATSPTSAQQGGAAGGVAVPADATVESLFVDYLHYARIGRFVAADAYASALLSRTDINPIEIVRLAQKDKEGVKTLLILIKSSSIGETATRILELIRVGEHELRQSTDRILTNLENLAGDPQQEFFARRYLAQSGEYAIPHMVQTLLDPAKSDLWPRVISALPSIGKGAVNPLVLALSMNNDDVRLHVIHALGEIGYPQAIAYLQALVESDSSPVQTKVAAAKAIDRIESIVGRSFEGMPDELFFALAEDYYTGDDSVRSNPTLETANVWYWDSSTQELRRSVVPQRIFGPVMAMRCCEEALRLKNDHGDAIALWLASNVRREHRLGMDVESGDPGETGAADATRPTVFPRALYFTQAAGPRYAHLMLQRAVSELDSAVALGAIAALDVTAGESSLIGTEDFKQPLVRALRFPDLVVRTRAALALGRALPKSQFAGSELVIPVLASAAVQTGREQVLVVDPDQASLNRIQGAVRSGDRDVIGETDFFKAIDRVRSEFQTLSGIFISTDLRDPSITEVLRRLRAEVQYSKIPVVVLTKRTESALAAEIALADAYAEPVDASADAAAFEDAFSRVRARTAQSAVDADLALSMATQAVETLRSIVVDGRTVYDARVAEPALIGGLSSTDEGLQILSASVLALLPAPTAQRAIAHVALETGNTDTLRIAAFASLAESAKSFGGQLEDKQVADLVAIARDEADLTLRTAASQALGAINLTTNQASDIVRSYYGG